MCKIYTILIPERDIDDAVKLFQSNLSTALNKEWYITFHTAEKVIVVFREKVFRVSGKGIIPIYQKCVDTSYAEDKQKWDEVVAYAKSLGVPDEQCENPIQISVYEDKIYIWNDGEMPPNLNTTEKLFMKHSSKPFNPKLAEVFFKSGMIEAWGRSFEKIREACALYDGPLPEYEINEAGIMVLCKACDKYLVLLRDDGHHPDHYPNQNGQDMNKLIINFCREPRSVQEIIDKFAFDSSYDINEFQNLRLCSRERRNDEIQIILNRNNVMPVNRMQE